MTTSSATTLLLAIVLALGLALPAPAAEPLEAPIFETPGEVPLLSRTYGLEWAEQIDITEYAISPVRVVIHADQKVAFLNRARGGRRVSFGPETARSMVCDELVNFSMERGRLRSGMLQTGDVASLCRLQPGVYPYRVERMPPSERSLSLSERPRGQIVVIDPPEAEDASAPAPVSTTLRR